MALCPKCSWPLVGPEGEMPRCANMNCDYEPQLSEEIPEVGPPEAVVRTQEGDVTEIASYGRVIATADADGVWRLHVAGEQFKLLELIEMMTLLEETLSTLRNNLRQTLNELADNATLAQ